MKLDYMRNYCLLSAPRSKLFISVIIIIIIIIIMYIHMHIEVK